MPYMTQINKTEMNFDLKRAIKKPVAAYPQLLYRDAQSLKLYINTIPTTKLKCFATYTEETKN
jgi:hypothetical protein